MEVWKKYDVYSCGVNDDGDLFLGGYRCGYNLRDTPENRAYIMDEFERILRDDGYTYVSRVGNFDTYRKIEHGKGKWIAEDVRTGEFFSITYEQALGYEPINPTPIENLARQLGKILLSSRA